VAVGVGVVTPEELDDIRRRAEWVSLHAVTSSEKRLASQDVPALLDLLAARRDLLASVIARYAATVDGEWGMGRTPGDEGWDEYLAWFTAAMFQSIAEEGT
jgi:hypothetical protein